MALDPFPHDNFNPYAATRESLSSGRQAHPPELKHAGLGIASFILALLCGFFVIVTVVIAGLMEVSSPDGIDEESVEAIAVGLAIIGSLLGCFVAFIFGIAGLFQSHRKKVFAILGILFSGLTLLATAGLIVLGLVTG